MLLLPDIIWNSLFFLFIDVSRYNIEIYYQISDSLGGRTYGSPLMTVRIDGHDGLGSLLILSSEGERCVRVVLRGVPAKQNVLNKSLLVR